MHYGGMSCSVVHMTKPASSKFAVDQRVEILAYAATIPGCPKVWMTGTVTAVELLDSERWAVQVARDDGLPPIQRIVGKRGWIGSRRIRAL